ncbi:MAG TPA: DM13 domain-containing protein [Dehalococcoidia bacterium]|nr:DM13 domain-containing protein [Dehalococcoidia bacterium]
MLLLSLTFLGEFERFLAELYPYRYPLTALLALALLLATFVAYRAGLHLWLWRRRVISGVLATPLLVASVVAGDYLLSPLWERTYLEEASPFTEALPPGPDARAGGSGAAVQAPAARQLRLTGEFMGADDFHFARGKAILSETDSGRYVLRLEDFSVRNGPDLYVYLSAGPTGRVDEALNLGRLKATDGAFNYDVPPSIDPRQIKSVLVWCRQFGVLFGSAQLMEF